MKDEDRLFCLQTAAEMLELSWEVYYDPTGVHTTHGYGEMEVLKMGRPVSTSISSFASMMSLDANLDTGLSSTAPVVKNVWVQANKRVLRVLVLTCILDVLAYELMNCPNLVFSSKIV